MNRYTYKQRRHLAKRKTRSSFKLAIIYLIVCGVVGYTIAHLPQAKLVSAHVEAYNSPQPTSTVTPTPTPKLTTREYIEKYIEDKFGEAADTAKKIVAAESSWNILAKNVNRNGTWDFCLFQINQIHGYSIEYLSDWKNCVDVAYKLYETQGFNPWRFSQGAWGN